MDKQAILAELPRLRRYARAMVGDRAAADDLVQDTLERAWSQLAQWRAGSSLRPWLLSIMHNLRIDQLRRPGLSISPMDDADLHAYYRAADVFCLPSVANSEAFGLVQIEAHAAGTPVVSTNLPTSVPYANLDGVTAEGSAAQTAAGGAGSDASSDSAGGGGDPGTQAADRGGR